MSLGTGCLVAVNPSHGMVVTNWHVVRDAVGVISVMFPDGFSSRAIILRTDKDWDLAALGIERPKVAPMVVSTVAPRPGDVLTIAGYGSSSYRAISGRCTEYLSPGGSMPAEIVELDVPARHGDSGGPIWNSRGEIAGVLFGAAGSQTFGGYTMGSYCGRVRWFLASAYIDFLKLPANPAVIAQTPPPFSPQQPVAQLQGRQSQAPSVPSLPVAALVLPPPPREIASGLANGAASAGKAPASVAIAAPAATPSGVPAVVPVMSAAPVAVSPNQPIDQIKTVLAGIGVIAVLFHGIRMLGAAVE